MKIIYARTQFWLNLKSGGSVGHTLGVLSGFEQNNCVVKIISNERFLGIADFNYSVIKPIIKSPSFFGEIIYNFYAKKGFMKEISGFKPDFIYHRYVAYTFFVAQIAKKLNIPLIIEFNSFETWKIKYWKKDKNLFKRFIKRYLLYYVVKKIEDFNLRNAFLIIAVSQPLKIDLVKLGIPEEKILVIPNGVDIEKFSPEITKSEECKELRQKLNIGPQEISIGFSGNFGIWHGIPHLTRAIDKIIKKRLIKNSRFLLIGDGPLREEMKRQIDHYRNVLFVGEVSYLEIQNYLAICDILLSPHCLQIDGREFFGSPTKLFEYMAMGKAIVASNLGQIGRVLRNKKTAVLVEPGKVDGLIGGILELADDKKLRDRLGKNARKEVVNSYTWRKNVEKLIKSFEILSDELKV